MTKVLAIAVLLGLVSASAVRAAEPTYCQRVLKRVARSLPDGGTGAEVYWAQVRDGRCTVLTIDDSFVVQGVALPADAGLGPAPGGPPTGPASPSTTDGGR